MTLLEIVQEFCKRSGLAVPNSVTNINDKNVRQVLGLANECLDQLSTVYSRWTMQTREATFMAVATESQGLLSTLAPGFLWMVPETLFNRTTKLKLTGPKTPHEWQLYKAVVFTSAYAAYRIQEGALKIYPVPTAGHSMAFEYKCKYLVTSSASALKEHFTADDDTFNLDSSLMLLGLRYLWKREKGLSYDEEKADFVRAVKTIGRQDGKAGIIKMHDQMNWPRPGVYIQDSNWPLP